jgi:hypothetical protein
MKNLFETNSDKSRVQVDRIGAAVGTTVGAALGLGGADEAGCCSGGGRSWSLRSRSDAQPTQAQASTNNKTAMRIALSWRPLTAPMAMSSCPG